MGLSMSNMLPYVGHFILRGREVRGGGLSCIMIPAGVVHIFQACRHKALSWCLAGVFSLLPASQSQQQSNHSHINPTQLLSSHCLPCSTSYTSLHCRLQYQCARLIRFSSTVNAQLQANCIRHLDCVCLAASPPPHTSFSSA